MSLSQNTDLQLAFSHLRPAVAECRLESRARAVLLIEKAVLSYKAVKKQLDELPGEFAEARCELRGASRKTVRGHRYG